MFDSNGLHAYGFPWLKWFCHLTKETSVRVKLIELYNLLSTVLTVALWLGNDDYEKTKKCGHAFNLQTTPTIIRRTCEFIYQFHLPRYPIPEAPEL